MAAKRNRSRGGRGRNRSRQHNTHHRRNRVTVFNRNPHRRRGFRRNPDTEFFVLGIAAAVAGLVINFISPKISFLSDIGITGAVKRVALGLVGRMLATWGKLSRAVADGIAVGGVVVGANQVFGGLGGLLPNTLIPVTNVPAVAVPQAAVAAGANPGVGRIVQMPRLVAQGGPGLGAIRPLNRYAGYRTY